MKNEANNLTKAVLNLINLSGFVAWRINSVGVFDPVKRIHRTSNQAKGLPDIIGIVNGRFIGIEIKIGADRQSEHQKDREAEINKAGGLYWIIKDFDTFHKLFKEIIKK